MQDLEVDVFFTNMENATARLTSSNTSVVRAMSTGHWPHAYLTTTGSAVLTAEFDNPVCDPITLNVTVEVTEAPTVGDTATTVSANSNDNAVTLDIDGSLPDNSDIASVAVGNPPNNGTATAAGTQISYTPNAGFSGTDSFTYTATNAAGTSTPATATINIEAATHTVSWSTTGPGSIGNVSFTDNIATLIVSPVVATEGRVISFWSPIPHAGATYSEPTGCGIRPVGLAWYTDPITADCAVSFVFESISFSPGSLPAATMDVPYVAQIAAEGGIWNFTYSLADGALPQNVTLNNDGKLSGTPTEAGDFTFTIRATNERGHFQMKSYTLTVGSGSHTVSFSAVGHHDIFARAFVNGTPLTSGDSVPDGTKVEFQWHSGGHGSVTLHGIGNTCGATHQDLNVWTATITGDCDVTFVVEPMAIEPRSKTRFTGTVGQPFSQQLTATGMGEFTWRVTNPDAFPRGISLNEQTGEISGIPTQAGGSPLVGIGTYNITHGGSVPSNYSFEIFPAPEVTIGPDSMPAGVAGAEYHPVTFTADGGAEPYSFTLTGDLPQGLTFADGTLSGTPVEHGSFDFTVTATDANEVTAERAYTLSVNAPEISIIVPTLPDGKVNTEYGVINFTASGGSEPYAFDLASGELPQGMALTEDGRLSGTPTEDGDFAFAVKATDAYGFEGTAEATLTIAALNLPVAQNHTLEVMAGTSGSLDLTQGATGGPFTAAAIAAHPESEAGTARIAREDGTHLLHFAAAGSFAGTASLTYTLSNAEGVSAPATVTITVIARPDPSLDPEVIGLIRAQTETTKRFANTQITNFNRRLEQLHNEAERRSNSIGVNMSVQQPSNKASAYAQVDDIPGDPALDAIERTAPTTADSGNPQPAPMENPFGDLAFWSGGFVNFGTNEDGAINLDHTLVGISAGMDYRFTPELTAGFGVGYGRDVTDIGSNGTENRAEAFSAALYGSYRPVPGFFLDGLAGYSTMSFDSRRFVTATGDFATGSRSGDQLFASLTAGYEIRDQYLLISPYGRLSGSHSTLDSFAETGAGMWDLTYGEQTIDTLSGTLGLRFQYAIPMEWGILTPRGRLEYTHDFEGSSRASLGYADIGTLPYGLDIEGFSRNHLAAGLGLDAQIGDSWKLGFDYRTAFGTNGDSQDHTFGLQLGVKF